MSARAVCEECGWTRTYDTPGKANVATISHRCGAFRPTTARHVLCTHEATTSTGTRYACTLPADHDDKHRLKPVTGACSVTGCTGTDPMHNARGGALHYCVLHDPDRLARFPTEKVAYKPDPGGRGAATGTLPVPWQQPAREFVAWMNLRGLSDATIQLRGMHLRRFAKAGHPHPWKVTKADVQVFMSNLDTLRPASRASLQVSLTVFYKWAVAEGKTLTDPTLGVPKPKVRGGAPKPVPDEDYAAALAKAPTPEDRMMLRLAGELGMRRGEVAFVHLDDIITTEEGDLLKVTGKGDKDRVIPIPATLAADLTELCTRNGGWAFPGPTDGHITQQWVGTRVTRLLPPGYSMHKLRHRALTKAYEHSKDLLLVATLAGHSNVGTTQKYYVAPDYTALRGIVEGLSS